MSDQSAGPSSMAWNIPSDDTAVTEIELTPDGRIYLLGASPQFLKLLNECGLGDEFTSDRLPGTTIQGEVAATLARNDGSK